MSATLQAKFQHLLKEATDLLAEGKIEEARAKRQEAETIKAQIDEWRVVVSLSEYADSLAPQRPPLPGTGDGSQVDAATTRAATPQGGIVQVDETPPSQPPVIRAAYINRVGRPDEEIEQIMVDLHGRDYAKMFWVQKEAFNKYLRFGDIALGSDDRVVLKQIIMTPGAVKTALRQGVGSVETLRTTMVEAADSLGGLSRSSARLTNGFVIA